MKMCGHIPWAKLLFAATKLHPSCVYIILQSFPVTDLEEVGKKKRKK
jgi:hypothetical protein